MTNVREAVLDICRRNGLTDWFGNPGSSELSLLQQWPSDFRYHLGLQEMIPVGMADGFAQVTGRPALVNLHTAPGIGNAMGALYNAAWNKTPLIVTAGNQRRDMQDQICLLTNVDATTLPRPFVKWAGEPAQASEVPAVLAHAIRIAMTPPMGPVFVSIPLDDVEYEFTAAQQADVDLLSARRYTSVASFDGALADELAKRIAAAKNPAFISSGDVERNCAVADLVALAETAKAAVYTAPFAGWSGFPEDHALYQGLIYPGRGLVSQQLKGHDLVIVLGGPAFRYYPYVPGPYLPEGTELVHLTSDPDEAARAPIGDAWVCNVPSAIRALRDRTTPSDRTAPGERPAPSSATADATPMDPEALWSTVGRVTPANTLYVTEAGSNEVVIASQVRSGHNLGHMSAVGGGLGFGLPAAVGAQLGAPDRPVVALMGDGSMNYAVTALWSAVNSKSPITVVVASNAEYGVLKEFAVVENAPGVPGLDLPGIDIVTVAKGYGVDAKEATSTDELADMLKAGVADRDRPTLINVRTTPVAPGHGLV